MLIVAWPYYAQAKALRMTPVMMPYEVSMISLILGSSSG